MCATWQTFAIPFELYLFLLKIFCKLYLVWHDLKRIFKLIASFYFYQDLLDKCQACMKIIRVAKDEQAEKANEYATILLEELDLEKTRAEVKKMAAARRKERKKNKKLQKIFEKRKLQEEEEGNLENIEEDADEEKIDDDEVEEEYSPPTYKDKKDNVKG